MDLEASELKAASEAWFTPLCPSGDSFVRTFPQQLRTPDLALDDKHGLYGMTFRCRMRLACRDGYIMVAIQTLMFPHFILSTSHMHRRETPIDMHLQPARTLVVLVSTLLVAGAHPWYVNGTALYRRAPCTSNQIGSWEPAEPEIACPLGNECSSSESIVEHSADRKRS